MGSYLYIELQQPSGMPFGDSQPPVTVGIAKDSATFRGKHAPPKMVLYTTLDIWIMMDCIFRQTSILLSAPTKPKRSPTAFCAASRDPRPFLPSFDMFSCERLQISKCPDPIKTIIKTYKNYQLFMAHLLPSSKKHSSFAQGAAPRSPVFSGPSSKNSL